MKANNKVQSSLPGVLLTGLFLALLVFVPVLAQGQSSRLGVNISGSGLQILADLTGSEVISIDVANPEGAVAHTESKQSPVWLSPNIGASDGSYSYDVQLVDEASGKTLDSLAGTFTVQHGQIVTPGGKVESKQGFLPGLWKALGQIAKPIFDLLWVKEAEAANLESSGVAPEILFDDTDDEDCSPSWDWRILTQGGVNDPDQTNFFSIRGVGELATANCFADVEIFRINHDGAAGAASPENSLVIDTNGDLRLANNGMFFNRANKRLGIGTTTPSVAIDAVGNQIRLRNNTTAGARTLMMRTDGTDVDLHSLNARLFLRSEGSNIVMNPFDPPDGLVGIGTTVPAAKLHVIRSTPPQFIVENASGNARMDFRRSAAAGVSQLLFGTGPLVGGTMDYQIGMFNNTIFQIRVTNDATKGISLTPTGTVGIGMTAPGAKLDVAGIVQATAFVSTSDGRLKENVEPIEGALSKVMEMEGVSFKWKKEEGTDRFPEGTHYGVVAQQMEKVAPEVVREGSGGQKAVSYTELIPVLIEAIKEQQKTISEQKKTISALSERLAAVERETKLSGSVASR